MSKNVVAIASFILDESKIYFSSHLNCDEQIVSEMDQGLHYGGLPLIEPAKLQWITMKERASDMSSNGYGNVRYI